MVYDLIRYFDMFAGIGGFRAGLTRAGGFRCVGYCEIDKYADASYVQTTLSRHKGERSSVLCLIGDTVRCGMVRRLMPRECLRLQGFSEDQIDRLLAITSDAQAYKQAGNSVTVNVIGAIGRNLRAVDAEIRGETA